MDIIDTLTDQTLRRYKGYQRIQGSALSRIYWFLDTPEECVGLITIDKPYDPHSRRYAIRVTIGDSGGDIAQVCDYTLNNPSVKLFINTLKEAARMITKQ